MGSRSSTSAPRCPGSGANSYQQDLLNLWWNLWKEQGFASLPPYGHLTEAKRHTGLKIGDMCLLKQDNKVLGTYRLWLVLSAPFAADGWDTKIKVGYRTPQDDKKCSSLNEIKIDIERVALLAPFNDMELLWEIATDNAVGHDPEALAATKDESLDALVKDAAYKNSSGKDPQGMIKQANLVKLGRKGAYT